MFHIAEKDDFCPPDSQAAIAKAFDLNENITRHSYPDAAHAFARVGGGNYNHAAAELADSRTAELLQSALS